MLHPSHAKCAQAAKVVIESGCQAVSHVARHTSQGTRQNKSHVTGRMYTPHTHTPLTSHLKCAQAVKVVIESGCQYHILLIIADGQVTRPSDIGPGELSIQEQVRLLDCLFGVLRRTSANV